MKRATCMRRCYISWMNAADVIARLKAMEPELRRSGVGSLYLFGSRARGDHRPDSDIDLLYDANDTDVDYLKLFDVKYDLAAMLRLPVDFVERRNLHALVKPFVEPDLVKIF